MRRRELLVGGLLLPLVIADAGAASGPSDPPADGVPFDAMAVRTLAKDLAAKPYTPPVRTLPDAFAHLTYDQYRQIRFNAPQALWRGMGLPFEAQFFHRGFLYQDRVDLFEVAGGRARQIVYNATMFQFGQLPPPTGDLGFSGFRIHAPIARPDYFDEICVFQGASYFRAVAKGQAYGLSARGLAIKTGDSDGEEFPVFKTFWLERPAAGTNAVVVHALLDSPSAAAAFRFTIRPGETTVFDVEMTLYPRVDIAHPGFAPATSMFFFDASDRDHIDDYRTAVHDSDGLSIATGRGEQLWRPLRNPSTLQLSAFADPGPRGFGLMQRKRRFEDFDDLEAHYEKRPSLWVEPIGETGEGEVHLVELPTAVEINDNIVAFWRPKQPIKAKSEVGFTYRLHWCGVLPLNNDLAQIVDTRAGLVHENRRLFVLDVAGGNRLKALPNDAKPTIQISAEHGTIQNAVAEPNPETGGWRLSFELAPGDAKSVEMRAQLMNADLPLSEVWIYRWTA